MALLLTLSCVSTIAFATVADGITVNVHIPESYDKNLNGRLLVTFANSIETKQPYEQLGVSGSPVYGKTYFDVKPGDTITMSSKDLDVEAYPLAMSELPTQDLYVQAFFIQYTKFERDELPAIWGMDDHGGGGNFKKNPYNLFSDAVLTSVDASGTEIDLSLTNEIPLGYELAQGQVTQQGNYEDTDTVKYVKMKSELLSDFWNTDIYLAANVLLPKDYDPNKQYPALYYQGHFPFGNAPFYYGKNEDFTAYWDSEDAPDIITITFRDANMFYDTSYSVNSANHGPYGDAIINEFIPYLEKEFNLIPESWARLLTGGSTGGWETLAMQLFNPDFFGGAWANAPDSVDFHHYQVVDLYNDENAYFNKTGEWLSVPRPGSVALDGNIRYTMQNENQYELVIGGEEAISLGQWAVWESVYGPVAENGYPERVYDPHTGEINKDVVAYWQENYDLNVYLQENWEQIGNSLVGKIHIRGGDMDAYYLNHAQYLMGEFLESTTAPYYDGYSKTFARKGHTGNISSPDLLKEMTDHMIKYGPENAKSILFGD